MTQSDGTVVYVKLFGEWRTEFYITLDGQVLVRGKNKDLCYARLEDEAALEALDVRFSRQGDSWQHLSRAILLYKLGRLAAARRALGGYTRLCEGGAYALIKPIMIDTYLPDRPETTPLSFEEATLAVHEADPVIVDVPDFVPWAQGQRDVWFAAQSFAERRDLDW